MEPTQHTNPAENQPEAGVFGICSRPGSLQPLWLGHDGTENQGGLPGREIVKNKRKEGGGGGTERLSFEVETVLRTCSSPEPKVKALGSPVILVADNFIVGFVVSLWGRMCKAAAAAECSCGSKACAAAFPCDHENISLSERLLQAAPLVSVRSFS